MVWSGWVPMRAMNNLKILREDTLPKPGHTIARPGHAIPKPGQTYLSQARPRHIARTGHTQARPDRTIIKPYRAIPQANNVDPRILTGQDARDPARMHGCRASWFLDL